MTFKRKKHLPHGDIVRSKSEPLISDGNKELKIFNIIEEIINDKFNYRKWACLNCDYSEDFITDMSREYLVFNSIDFLITTNDEEIKLFKINICIYKLSLILKVWYAFRLFIILLNFYIKLMKKILV